MDRLIEGGGYRGREGIEAYFETNSRTWEEFELLPDELRDLSDRLLWLGRVERADGPAASGSIRRLGQWSSFATARCRASAPFSITTRHCGRQDCLSRSRAGVRRKRSVNVRTRVLRHGCERIARLVRGFRYGRAAAASASTGQTSASPKGTRSSRRLRLAHLVVVRSGHEGSYGQDVRLGPKALVHGS